MRTPIVVTIAVLAWGCGSSPPPPAPTPTQETALQAYGQEIAACIANNNTKAAIDTCRADAKSRFDASQYGADAGGGQ